MNKENNVSTMAQQKSCCAGKSSPSMPSPQNDQQLCNEANQTNLLLKIASSSSSSSCCNNASSYKGDILAARDLRAFFDAVRHTELFKRLCAEQQPTTTTEVVVENDRLAFVALLLLTLKEFIKYFCLLFVLVKIFF